MTPLGAGKQAKLKAISIAPSFNYTNSKRSKVRGFTLVQTLDNAVGTASKTTFNGQPAYLLDQSTQPTCTGDEAGWAGGVKSGTVGGTVKPTSGSSSILIESKQIVREGDSCTMNNENCYGKYVSLRVAQLMEYRNQDLPLYVDASLGTITDSDKVTFADNWEQFKGIPHETGKLMKEDADKIIRNLEEYSKYFGGTVNAGMLTAARDIAEMYSGDYTYFEGGINIGGVKISQTLAVNVHNGKVYTPVTANAGLENDSKPSTGAVVGVGWILDSPDNLTEDKAMDTGLGGRGSYTGIAYGGGAIVYSQTDDATVKMVSLDVGKSKGGSRDKIIGIETGSTNMKIFELSDYNIKYDPDKKEYIYDNNKKWHE